MTLWIIHQTTDYCQTAVEEFAYKCLLGAVYFFDYLRLTDNRIRYHVCFFYALLIGENASFYLFYVTVFKNLFHPFVLVIATVLVLGGTFVGTLSILMHFCMFQNVKTLKLVKRARENTEISVKKSPVKKSPLKKWTIINEVNDSGERMTPDITADKTSLLTSIVQRFDSLDKGIINQSFCKGDETNVTVEVVVEDKSKVASVDVSIGKLQGRSATDKKGDESSTSCSVDISIKDAELSDSLQRQKRRGICSEEELESVSVRIATSIFLLCLNC